MSLESVRALLLDELRETLASGMRLSNALPIFAKAELEPGSYEDFATQLKDLEIQLVRLNEALGSINDTIRTEIKNTRDRLLQEDMPIVPGIADSRSRNVTLTMAALKIEHFTIAAFGIHAILAKLLSHTPTSRFSIDALDQGKGRVDALKQHGGIMTYEPTPS